ncbi:dynein light chain 1, axonemal-like [Ctenocephalides felis]|uniref:dynein light chain 1, axonemal-like n=1 Tax=Ctenocephalides felis TaxID=7515 RepID=UPI000E6E4B63|nr:dynein light chain 1, axonemal-like [Ctenocephalides felis]
MALRPTSIKEALKRWEEKHPDIPIGEALDVQLQFQWPPIEKMDNSLNVLVKCEKLSLSTNMIDKIAGISSLKNLKILSLARNYIKNLTGLEGVADTLEELWLSYNLIEKLKGIGVLKRLKVLYISNNLIKDWSEFNKLQEVPTLQELLMIGNPLVDSMDEETWRREAVKRLGNLKNLDGQTILRAEDE